ncbi:MAG: hypothetical protein IJ064_00675 [Bacteroidaceae bacterium]|nr:hypothetical protein [Bacteroidaceae bacterium]
MEKQADNSIAKRFLKMEMLRRGISTEDLQMLLSKRGHTYTLSSINSKISRGTFSASFMIECLEAMKCDKIELNNIVVDNE